MRIIGECDWKNVVSQSKCKKAQFIGFESQNTKMEGKFSIGNCHS